MKHDPALNKDPIKSYSTKAAKRAQIEALIKTGKGDMSIAVVVGCSRAEVERIRTGSTSVGDPYMAEKFRGYDG